MKDLDILKSRNSKMLGSIVSEQVVKDRFISKSAEITDKWFVGLSKKNKQYFFVLTLEDDKLSKLDKEVANNLIKNNFFCFKITNDGKKYKITDLKSGEQFSINKFIKEKKLERISKKERKKQKHEGKQMKQCIDYLVKEKRISQVASSIYIEEKLLNKYFYLSNIDMIVKYNGNIWAVEAKFSRRHSSVIEYDIPVFSINKFQVDMIMKPFLEMKFKFLFVVLENTLKKNKDFKDETEIFEFLDHKEKEVELYVKELEKIELCQIYIYSRKGERQRKYWQIPIEEFTVIRK